MVGLHLQRGYIMNCTRSRPAKGYIHLDDLTAVEYLAFLEMIQLVCDPKFDKLHVYPTPHCLELAKDIAALLGCTK